MTVRVILVRHGEAEARWTEHRDPGLSDEGRQQARALARTVEGLGPLPVLTSPLRRTRETASALEDLWSVEARVEPAVAELPSPDDLSLEERGTWLRELMGRRWPDMPVALQEWRRGVLDALRSVEADAVIVTHFLPINAVVGEAAGDERVVGFRPAYCSQTVVEVGDDSIRLVSRGGEADTVVR